MYCCCLSIIGKTGGSKTISTMVFGTWFLKCEVSGPSISSFDEGSGFEGPQMSLCRVHVRLARVEGHTRLVGAGWQQVKWSAKWPLLGPRGKGWQERSVALPDIRFEHFRGISAGTLQGSLYTCKKLTFSGLCCWGTYAIPKCFTLLHINMEVVYRLKVFPIPFWGMLEVCHTHAIF